MKQVFSIPSIHCSGCVLLLESMEEDVPGVTTVSVDLGRQTATIEFDEDTLSTEDIIAAIKTTSGYEASANES